MSSNHRPDIHGKIQRQSRLPNRVLPPSKVFSSRDEELEVEDDSIEDFLGLEEGEDDGSGSHPFLNGSVAWYPSSTNIFWVRFFPSTGEVMIQYRRQKGLPYLYASNLGEVKAFLQAQSKGKYAIAVYRPRAYKQVPSSYSPKPQTI